jgi:hypothetical protein
MWIPKSCADLIAALTDLQESSTIEFKREFPVPGRNEDLAVDIAAMTTDGGTIIYGLAENRETGVLTPNPIPLHGLKERITNVVRSSISGDPVLEVPSLDPGEEAALSLSSHPRRWRPIKSLAREKCAPMGEGREET